MNLYNDDLEVEFTLESEGKSHAIDIVRVKAYVDFVGDFCDITENITMIEADKIRDEIASVINEPDYNQDYDKYESEHWEYK